MVKYSTIQHFSVVVKIFPGCQSEITRQTRDVDWIIYRLYASVQGQIGDPAGLFTVCPYLVSNLVKLIGFFYVCTLSSTNNSFFHWIILRLSIVRMTTSPLSDDRRKIIQFNRMSFDVRATRLTSLGFWIAMKLSSHR